MALADGDFVTVPLGARQVTGVVWGEAEGGVPASRLKEVLGRLDAPPMATVMRRFVDWVAAYTCQPKGSVLKMAMSVPDALAPPKPIRAYALADGAPGVRMTPARSRVLEVLAEGPPRTAIELTREAGCGAAVVRGLAEAGVLVAVDLPPALPWPAPDWRLPGLKLSESQEQAAAGLREKAGAGEFSVTLLDGVPGSGKTEVYFQAVAETLKQGRQVLVLLPEIALGAQWLQRFRARFGVEPASWHSELTAAARRDTWRAVAEASVQVIVGARSALFLPFPDLGLIVVDEEHDASFKQEDGVIYNARDMAVVRARLGGFPAVLVSATPSLETVTNAQDGRYGALHLADRHGGAVLPGVEIADLREDKPAAGRWLCDALVRAVEDTLGRGEQAMLFLNRRGYAPLTLCRTCGHRLQCPRCTAWLVEHRTRARLGCHHCGFETAAPETCPSCSDTESFAACGPGVERLAEEAGARFPGARQVLAASDTITRPSEAAELVRRIEDHEVDIIIGTQIVAKGYHFPLLTLVGVVDADLGLAGGDLRAAERTYQLLYQVSGRAGRAERRGRVLLQTYMPGHPVMQALAAGDRDRFLAAEGAARREGGMPPFGRLAALIVSGRDAAQVERAAADLGRGAPSAAGVRVLGPAPAPLALLRGRHRWRLLLKAEKNVNVQAHLGRWLAAVKVPGGVRVQVDVDPYGFL